MKTKEIWAAIISAILTAAFSLSFFVGCSNSDAPAEPEKETAFTITPEEGITGGVICLSSVEPLSDSATVKTVQALKSGTNEPVDEPVQWSLAWAEGTSHPYAVTECIEVSLIDAQNDSAGEEWSSEIELSLLYRFTGAMTLTVAYVDYPELTATATVTAVPENTISEDISSWSLSTDNSLSCDAQLWGASWSKDISTPYAAMTQSTSAVLVKVTFPELSEEQVSTIALKAHYKVKFPKPLNTTAKTQFESQGLQNGKSLISSHFVPFGQTTPGNVTGIGFDIESLPDVLGGVKVQIEICRERHEATLYGCEPWRNTEYEKPFGVESYSIIVITFEYDDSFPSIVGKDYNVMLYVDGDSDFEAQIVLEEGDGTKHEYTLTRENNELGNITDESCNTALKFLTIKYRGANAALRVIIEYMFGV